MDELVLQKKKKKKSNKIINKKKKSYQVPKDRVNLLRVLWVTAATILMNEILSDTREKYLFTW